jgi:transcriptional regulator with XRE-family HTH domain
MNMAPSSPAPSSPALTNAALTNTAPSVRRRLLGAALRRYREALGYTLAEAARTLDCDRSAISRIETGQRGIRARDLRDLLTEYGIGEHEQTVLIAIANPRRASGWWQDYDDILTGDWRDYLILESLAARVFSYHTQQIPGLLQTEAYADAVADASPPEQAAAATGSSPSVHQRAVAATLARQAAILRAKEPELNVIITEGALRQQVGGADVMRTQLAWLAGLSASCPRLTLQVLPFASGAHPGFEVGGLTILTFAETSDLGIVRIPGIGGGIYLDDRDAVPCHISAFAQIRAAALSAPASSAMLSRLATE